MTSIKEVKRFQEFLMNAWPAEQYYFLNGWILRFTKGVTYRANSVIPINYTGNSAFFENDIKMVENAYKSFIEAQRQRLEAAAFADNHRSTSIRLL